MIDKYLLGTQIFISFQLSFELIIFFGNCEEFVAVVLNHCTVVTDTETLIIISKFLNQVIIIIILVIFGSRPVPTSCSRTATFPHRPATEIVTIVVGTTSGPGGHHGAGGTRDQTKPVCHLKLEEVRIQLLT